MGGLFAFGDFPAGEGPPRSVAWVILGVGLGLFLIGLAVTCLTYLAGRSLDERRRRTLCMIVAGLWCFWVPFGTAIGVCAILVLNRPSVEALFGRQGNPPAMPSSAPSAT